MKKIVIPLILIAICCFSCEVVNNKEVANNTNIENKIKELGPAKGVNPLPNGVNGLIYIWEDITIGNVVHVLNKPDEVYRGVFPGEVPKITLFINLLETYDKWQIFQDVFRWGHYHFFEMTKWDGTKYVGCIHTNSEWEYEINKNELKIMWNKLPSKEQSLMLKKAVKADGEYAVAKGLVILLGFTDKEARNIVDFGRDEDAEKAIRQVLEKDSKRRRILESARELLQTK